MIRVRRLSILFAVASAIYWEGIAWFLSILNPIAGIDAAPYWMVMLANAVPASLYAVITLVFCHWLARRVVKQVLERSGQ
jgi:hypothetical protein